MKKLYLFLATIFIGTFAQGQNYLYQAFGSGVWPPAGWTSMPIGSQWSLSPTDTAGGMLPEALFEGFNYTGTARLISPFIDVTEADTLILSFRYFPFVDPENAPDFGVATRSGGGTWEVSWQTELHNANEPREFEVLLTGENLGKTNFQFSFFITGDMINLDKLYLDNILLYFPTTSDGKLDEILTPAHVELPEPVIARIINLGNTTINQASVTFITNMGILHDTILPGLNLGLYESHVFQFNRWWVSSFGDYPLKMWLNSVNGNTDPNPANDTLIKSINYSMPPRPMRPPLFETFTSSTCGACYNCAEVFVPWCEHHPGIVLIKYPMPWPGNGDPYYTLEGEQRRVFYDLNSVPWTYINGIRKYNVDTSFLQPIYDSAMMLTSDFIINSTFSINNTTITITNNIFPYESASGIKVHTVVVEKITTGNIGGNGQTEFHHVMMKMFPDGNGEQVAFYANMPYKQTFTANLEETFVEEYDDLMVAVFIQQDSSKEVLQSTYAVEDGIFSGEDRLSMILLDGEPLEGFNPDIYNYDLALPISAVESPVVLGIPIQDSAMMIIKQADYLPGPAVIDVYPESRGTMKRYIVSFSYMTGLDTPDAKIAWIYPNPVINGKIFIEGIEPAIVKLFTLDGRLMINLENSHLDMIDVSGINSGIYILYLADKNGIVVRKKIVVM